MPQLCSVSQRIERVLLHRLPNSFDIGAVFANPVKQFALRINTHTNKKGRSFRTTPEEPSLH